MPTGELRECKLVVRTLRKVYAEKPAAEFGPLSLKAARQGWVNAGPGRAEVNRRTNLARRMFRWSAGGKYSTMSYNQVIARGIDRANAARKEAAAAAGRDGHDPIPPWSANQLRHSGP